MKPVITTIERRLVRKLTLMPEIRGQAGKGRL
jgi:hypothetical protein